MPLGPAFRRLPFDAHLSTGRRIRAIAWPGLDEVACSMSSGESVSYRDAGVNVDAGNRLIDRIKRLAATTTRDGVLGGIGGFAAMVRLPAGATTIIQYWWRAATAWGQSFRLPCARANTIRLGSISWP